MMRRTLTEGMRAGDLADLVLPLVSVDEYESKVDPKRAVVFGFYVHDQDAANDLNRFVQKSAVPVLDTELSPAPDQHGYYLLFVEMLHNERLAHNLIALLEELTPLADIDDWRLRVRKTKGLLPATVESLDKALLPAERTDEAAMIAFLQDSDLDQARFDRDGHLCLETYWNAFHFAVRGFGPLPQVLETLNLTTTPDSTTLQDVITDRNLTVALGEGWAVQTLAEGTRICTRSGRDEALVLRRP